MSKKKTIYSWFILVNTGIIIILVFASLVLRLLGVEASISQSLFTSNLINNIYIVLSVISLTILVIFFLKLYNVRKDLIKWTHITFGYFVFQAIFGFMLNFISLGLLALLGIIPLLFSLVIPVLIWFTFVNHLKRARKENLMDFS